ncbi:hypothetical protein NDU88_004776 [Pleurodeles waltl]|uniref:Uncharacterized protein n=1 Tax=Pleurodeles waltl TaxID=8319 RepID=A0AAV7W7N7_PLEWA|nr:hypothetical protein NDU88_004776 [Pleurodeles waltl]
MHEGKASKNREQTALRGSAWKVSKGGLDLTIGVADLPRVNKRRNLTLAGLATVYYEAVMRDRETEQPPIALAAHHEQARTGSVSKEQKALNRAPLSPAPAPRPD